MLLGAGLLGAGLQTSAPLHEKDGMQNAFHPFA